MLKPITVSCPVCGAFQQGLDPIGMVVFLGRHQMSMVCTDEEYEALVDKALTEAEGVVR